MSKFQWRDDPDAVAVLRDIVGLPYVKGSISLKEIDWSESANNCARLDDPFNSEKIEDYATCIRRGDVFPRIVVERRKSKYTILGGNQRSAALKAIDDTARIDAYIVDPLTADERELVIRSLNSRHGWGSTKEERIQHAVYLVRRYGMHVDTVTRAMVVSHDTIRKHIRSEDERENLAKNGIDSSSLSIKALASIASIADEETKLKVAKLASEKQLAGDTVSRLVTKVLSCKSRAHAAKEIAEARKAEEAIAEVRKRKGGKLRKPRREKFLNLLTSLSDFLDRGNDGDSFDTLEDLCCSKEHDLDNIRVLSAKVNARLSCICEAGK